MSEGQRRSVAVLGGTGNLGQGIALRLAMAGHAVTIGSRQADRANASAAALSQSAGAPIVGTTYADAAAVAEIVFLAVPFASQSEVLDQVAAHLAGKILVDTTVPLVPPKVARVQLPVGGSAAVIVQMLLGDSVRVVSALQNVAAAHLREPGHAIDCDVLVTGDDKAARGEVIALIEAMGLRGWHAGPLANSTVAEAMTSVLIFLNKTYGIDGAGIRITGTPTIA